MLILWALPSTYEVVQQTILANVKDYKTLTSDDMQSRLLSKELCQGTTIGVNAIQKTASTNTCNWCRGTRHWERDCRRKQQGLSREEAQSERKKSNKLKGKGKQKDEKKDSPLVNVVIQEISTYPLSSNIHVNQVSNNDTMIFYTGHETKWMLDSGCSDHITHETSDFSEYHHLTNLEFIQADGITWIPYLRKGTITATTHINSSDKTILLHDVIHCPDLGGQFLSIWKVGGKGIETIFAGNKATLSQKGNKCAKG